MGRVLEAPCPSGAHRGLCLVWGEQETPHPGEKPSQPQGGPGHHFLCRWTHPGWFASGSWWGGGSGYREAGSSLPRLPALSYRTHCRGGGSIVGMAVWWQRADKTVPVGFTQPPDSSQCQLDPRRPAVQRARGLGSAVTKIPLPRVAPTPHAEDMRGLNDPTAIQNVDVLCYSCYSFSPFNRLLLAASPELVPGILRQLAPAALPEYSLGEDTGLGADTQEPQGAGTPLQTGVSSWGWNAASRPCLS